MTDQERIKRLAHWMGWTLPTDTELPMAWLDATGHWVGYWAAHPPDGYNIVAWNMAGYRVWDPINYVQDAISLMLKANADDGACYSLINDDFGHWACVTEGIQPCYEKFQGDTIFFVEVGDWADTIERAICKAIEKLMEEA